MPANCMAVLLSANFDGRSIMETCFEGTIPLSTREAWERVSKKELILTTTHVAPVAGMLW